MTTTTKTAHPKAEVATCERDHCDEGDCLPCEYCDGESLAVVRAVHDWHNASHKWAFQFCDESPCREVRAVQ